MGLKIVQEIFTGSQVDAPSALHPSQRRFDEEPLTLSASSDAQTSFQKRTASI
jgi:hypothetical protein